MTRHRPTTSGTRASVPGDSRQFRHKTCGFVRSRAEIRPCPRTVSEAKTSPYAASSVNGETRTRTGDTTIFSRVLYQLSYLAAAPKASGPDVATPPQERGPARPRAAVA
jgi:hypothetical protein